MIVGEKEIKSEWLKDINPDSRHPKITIVSQDDRQIQFKHNNKYYTINEKNELIKDITPKGFADLVLNKNKHSISGNTCYQSPLEKKYITEIKLNNKITRIYTTNKLHTIFLDDQGNIHTIQEEKLRLPILGILGDLFLFMVRYHDVQLTRYNPKSNTHIILRQNPFGIRNAIRVINGLFLCWVFMKIYSKCYA